MRLVIAFAAVGALALATLVGAGQVRRETATGGASLLYFAPTLVALWLALLLEIRARPYSLHLVHLVGLYVFLTVAPLYQSALGYFPLPNFAKVTPDIVLRTNLAVMLWILFYLIAYSLANGRFTRGLPRPGRFLQREVPGSRIDIMLVLTLPTLIYLVVLGIGGVTTRAGVIDELLYSSTSSTLYVIQARLVRSFPFIALGAALLAVRRGQRRMTTLLLLPPVGLATIWADNPLAAPRFWTIAVTMGLVAPHFLRKRRTGVATLAAMLLGLLIVPGLGASRYADTTSEVIENVANLSSPVAYLASSGDVSAYGMMTLVWRYVDRYGYTYGAQMGSAVLFWVPRVFWPGKSTGTGHKLATELGFEFTNRAAPIVAEPLIDFGWIGVPVVAVAFGVLLALLDASYFAPVGARVRVIDLFYPFLLGLIVFVTRGDLITTLAAVMGFVAAALPFAFFLKRDRPQPDSAVAPELEKRNPEDLRL